MGSCLQKYSVLLVATARNKLETCINTCSSKLYFIKLILWHLIILLSVWESMGTVHFILK